MTPEQEREYVDYVTVRLPALRRVAYFLCGDEHRADDLVQQTMTSLYLHWLRARTVANLEGYVHRILVRAHLSERRLSWSSRVRLVGDTPPEQPSAPGGEVEERAVVQAALARIPPRQRAVLVLRFLCDLPVDEVAGLLGCSAGTVKSQTSHGLAALRRLLGETALANMG
ncbi:MAG TPA: SigE family RNA polymerase sigma factor [Pilimelia sp.]|nr:SigE family RNA polymerase sigma factor [Pilimelia sp.]